MNKKLREHIVKHIFSNFAIIPSDSVNFNVTKSLRSKDLLLPESMSFLLDDGVEVNNNVWGCQLSVDLQEIKILLADCSLEKEITEYALLVHLKNNPFYGVYFVHSNDNDIDIDNEAMIACSLDGKTWMDCQTYLQATFLAGMEQIRDIGFIWNKSTNYTDEFNAIKSFIKFHHLFNENQ